MSDKIGAEVWYLFNSGFAVKIGGRLLIFDYYNFMPFKKAKGLDSGVINPEEIKDLDVTVFASHAHMDHFVPSVLKWDREIPKISYVLSYDIEPSITPAHMIKAFPDERYELDGLKVRTLRSNDEGVAFIVEVAGLKIYHAGDLNWWHWEGEPDADNAGMAEAYKAEIDKVKGETFDIAFVPVDPRLEKEYLWGLHYFMQASNSRAVFPMHFRNHYSVFKQLDNDPMTKEYRGRIVKITHRGERFEI